MSIKSSEIPIDRKSEADSPLDIEDVTASSHRTSAKQSEKRNTLASPIVEKWGQPFDPLHWKKKAWMPRHVGQGFPDRSLRSCRFSKDARNPLSTLFFFSYLFVCLFVIFFFFTRASTCTQRAASPWPVGSTLLHNPFCWIRLPLFLLFWFLSLSLFFFYNISPHLSVRPSGVVHSAFRLSLIDLRNAGNLLEKG